MDKVYMVTSYFEDYESSRWQLVGLYTDKKLADETAKKWEDFYEDMKYSIFNEPKGWKPSEEDLEFGAWEESLEYSNRKSKYSDLVYFSDIIVEEFDLNKDLSLNNSFTNDGLLSLMTQWDRNHKLNKII